MLPNTFLKTFNIVEKAVTFSTVSTSVPVKQAYYGSPANLTVLLDDLVCTGSESNLLDCPRESSNSIANTDCTHSEDAGVRCEGEPSCISACDLKSLSC